MEKPAKIAEPQSQKEEQHPFIAGNDIFTNTSALKKAGFEGFLPVSALLGLEDDFLKLAADDLLGKKLQDVELLSKK